MFTENEYKVINNNYLEIEKQRKKKIGVIIFYAILITVLLGVGQYILNQLMDEQNDAYIVIYFFLLFSMIITGLVAVIALIAYISKMTMGTFYSYIFLEVIEHMNQHEGLFYKYSNEKEKHKELAPLIEPGHLFPHGGITSRYHISGFTKVQHPFDLFDLSIVTNSGQSSTTHFDGIYFKMHTELNTEVQIRNLSKPRVKGLKFDVVRQDEKVKVFKPENQHMNEEDERLYVLMKPFYQDMRIRYAFLSVVNHELHLAIWYKKHPLRRFKTFDINQLNEILNSFNHLFEIMNQFDELN
ncbi:MAG: hypothetical protein AB7E61_00715 [Acholeplasmataceae bacterium]